jgi:hypothetical protein
MVVVLESGIVALFMPGMMIPALVRISCARFSGVRPPGHGGFTAKMRTASRAAPVRMFFVIHARPNSAIPMTSSTSSGTTRAN